MTEAPPPEILSETTARRRLAIYTVIRLFGIGALFGGVWLMQGGIGVGSTALLLVGAASLLIRPKMLAAVLGGRW